MALEEFWKDVRRASRLVAPRVAPEVLQRDTSLWRTPKSVSAFDKRDFAFLPPDEPARLANAVEQFRRVINSTIQAGSEIAHTQQDRARVALDTIVNVLDFRRFADPVAFRVGKQIEAAIAPDRPERLAELRFATGRDHDGDPVLWVTAIFAEDDEEEFLRLVDQTRPLLQDAAREAEPDLWPHLSFTTVSEEQEEAKLS